MASTTAVLVGTGSPTPIQVQPLPSAAVGMQTVVISNLGANPVFLGGPNVTATTGVQVPAGQNLVLPGTSAANLYAVATTAASNVVLGVF